MGTSCEIEINPAIYPLSPMLDFKQKLFKFFKKPSQNHET
jgi:hypothetical protein